MPNLIKKIQNYIFANSLFGHGAKIVLGVSGGPDSTCLLSVFFKLQKKYGLELSIAHVNYHLRGYDSDQDEHFVEKLAEKYKLSLDILDAKIESGNKSEEKLRDVRYAFLEEVRKENKFDFIAVAHNCDDQAETVLMRLIRGTGLAGLSAMNAKNGKIIRPLLDTTRKEIIDYLKSNKLNYRIDKTNRESIYLRNKIRNKLIPYLEKNFNPNVKLVLAKSAKTFSEDYAVIEDATEKAWLENKKLSAKKILALPVAIQKRVLQRALAEKKSESIQENFNQIEEILKALKSTKNKNQVVSGAGLKMTRRGDKLTLSASRTPATNGGHTN
ncbi:MAG: tRNA lysidine(34) synthetase TilS [Candidatus Moranbacteria bacterium]|nr:tRNA lysidine(34) synthetase TilS [Candidatus Moranbacteria bacterium]